MIRQGRRMALLVCVAGLLVCSTRASAKIDLEWSPVSPEVLVGQTVDIRLYAVSDSAEDQCLNSISAILSWDPDYLMLVRNEEHEDNGPYVWLASVFPADSPLNDTYDDGDAYYTVWRWPSPDPEDMPYATPEGLLVTTMHFVALQETPPTEPTELHFIRELGYYHTRVLDCLIPGLDVTGRLRSAWVSILPCESPGNLDGDCDIDLDDHAAVIMCLTGPDAGPVEPGCEPADFDDDDDVDLYDIAAFQAAFTQP